MFDQRGELPLLPFRNPIGFVPASRGRVYIESNTFDLMTADSKTEDNYPHLLCQHDPQPRSEILNVACWPSEALYKGSSYTA